MSSGNSVSSASSTSSQRNYKTLMFNGIILGEDRFLTQLLLEGSTTRGTVGFCPSARCKTDACGDVWTLVRQRRRWYLGGVINEALHALITRNVASISDTVPLGDVQKHYCVHALSSTIYCEADHADISCQFNFASGVFVYGVASNRLCQRLCWGKAWKAKSCWIPFVDGCYHATDPSCSADLCPDDRLEPWRLGRTTR